MFHTKVVQKLQTHILCSIRFFENRAVNEIRSKNIIEGSRPQITTQSMRIAKATNTHTHRLRNINCFSTTTMVARTRLNVIRSLHILLVISRKVLLGIRNVSDRSCRENRNIHFMFKNVYPKIVFFYELMWKNTVKPDGPQMTIKYDAVKCDFHAG